MIRECPACGANNRVPAKHLSDTGRCGSCKSPLPPVSEPIEVDTAAFAEITREAKVPVLVDFWAPWCGPCRQIAPHVEALAGEFAGKLKVGKINVDDNPSVPTQYRVQGIPTLLLFKGGQVQEQIVGFVPKDVLKRAIDKHV